MDGIGKTFDAFFSLFKLMIPFAIIGFLTSVAGVVALLLYLIHHLRFT